MNKKLAIIPAILVSAGLLLTGCSANTTSADSKISNLKAPQGFVEESKKDNTVVFAALKEGKTTVDEASFCGPLFDWAYSNGLTRFQLIDNTFQLKDYTKDGTEMGKTSADNGPWVAACNTNFGNIKKLNADSKDPATLGTNPNWDKDIVFFGKDKDGVDGSAYVSAGFNGDTKYVKLTVSYDDAKK